ncbi:MAG: ornithine decarboxylase, partial [Halobacteriovoraceae bacterium]|nr:ornithine decarboxylase [Halobacteriovoraceae bacterium]
IVMQANLCPGDIVLISSDCHKSIPYGIVLTGASVIFLQTNAVEKYDLYGAISLSQIKDKMRDLEKANLLGKLKQIILTNSTFDGALYDVESYMLEILAIKADVIFHWDEAWCAHTHFHPLYERRHAMSVAQKLKNRFSSSEYLIEYKQSKNKTRLPDPQKVKVRAYATQSTHKTLSSFRQGSMIHICDELFNTEIFLDAFYTHTSTSPNYQILASLDVARRQMGLEGYAMVQKSIELSSWLKLNISTNKKVSKFFKILNVYDLFPDEEIKKESSGKSEFEIFEDILDFQQSGMRLDPSRVTLDVSKTGLSGSHFRKLLINRYNIQVNKTSRHTVLFIINIGASRKSVKYLYDTLANLADYLHGVRKNNNVSNINQEASLAMPQKRRYDEKYLPYFSLCPEIIDMRSAYFDAYESANIEHVEINSSVLKMAANGKTWTSAAFVTPYPPGFPLLVPGQMIDYKILVYIASIIDDEIHGFHKEVGLKIFKG